MAATDLTGIGSVLAAANAAAAAAIKKVGYQFLSAQVAEFHLRFTQALTTAGSPMGPPNPPTSRRCRSSSTRLATSTDLPKRPWGPGFDPSRQNAGTAGHRR
ncbi:PE family protein [Mycobacterium basiliense]|uniref:PE family protein n=2 Tax=Mycobacterium basiliense TaxID=2094119 RepID=A0A3S4CYP0_9MYCO|nr:PE family protein [Mycobacterium basiliense]VDM90375.1 PE family protein [Mycobacterium basiliense]